MAVQAQYPSNVLLFNRNSQDSKNMLSSINNNNYPLLQPSSQPGTATAVAGATNNGEFLLDQSHHLIISPNGAAVGKNNTNPRKRGRDVMATTATAATTTTTSTAANNHHHHQHLYTHTNPFSSSLQNHHHHPPQLIELSRLQQQQPPPNPGVSTGLKLSFGDHHQIQQQMQPNHHSLTTNNNQYSLPSPVLIPLLSSDHVVNQINQQSDDLNQLIHTHVEQLHRTVAEKRQRHYQTLLTAVEESLTQRLRDKESQIEKAARRHAELEARGAQLSAEAQLWQAKARAQEAQAASLQAQLQEAMMLANNGTPSKPAVDGDGILGCSEGGDAEDAESAYIDPDRVVAMTMPETAVPGCRACGVRAATVVILPCRHLCVCVECDGVVQTCPVCVGMRNSSVEVFLT